MKRRRSDRIAEKIAELQKQLREAKRHERDARRRNILRAAVRAGLDELDIELEVLTGELARITKKHGGAVPKRRGRRSDADAAEAIEQAVTAFGREEEQEAAGA